MIATRTLNLRICAFGILMLFEPLRLSVVLPSVLLTVRIPLPTLLEARAVACRPTLSRDESDCYVHETSSIYSHEVDNLEGAGTAGCCTWGCAKGIDGDSMRCI
jgi:hypothetical protein